MNVCKPWVRPVYAFGLVHAAAAPASSLHVNVAGVAVAWKVNVALVLVVAAGGALSMIVSGGGAGVVAETAAESADTLPHRRGLAPDSCASSPPSTVESV